MPTYVPIKIRSPRFVERSGLSGGEVIDVELFIWNEPNAEPATANYSFTKTIPSTLIDTFTIDISPFCLDYISTTNYTDGAAEVQANNGDWCYCRVKLYEDSVLVDAGGGYTHDFICFNGFGYFLDGQNPSVTSSMMEAGTYYANETGNPGGIGYFDNGAVAGAGVQAKYTGLTTGGTTTLSANYTVGYFPMLHSSYASEGNKVEYMENSIVIKTYYVEAECENKYTTIDCDFINRYGFWQRLTFFKNSEESFSRTSKPYNLMSDDTDYSTKTNRRQEFNINGKLMITCNSGWVSEEHDEVIKDLMLSPRILLNDVPANIKTGSMKIQTHLTDKVINYQVQFEYSHNQRNYNT